MACRRDDHLRGGYLLRNQGSPSRGGSSASIASPVSFGSSAPRRLDVGRASVHDRSAWRPQPVATPSPQPQPLNDNNTPPPAGAPSAAASAWSEHHSPGGGSTYYFNAETRETTWERPAELPPERRAQCWAASSPTSAGGKSFSKSPTADAPVAAKKKSPAYVDAFRSSFEEKRPQRDADVPKLRMSLERALDVGGPRRGYAAERRPAAADEYQAPEQADWARARLLGPAAAKEARDPSDDLGVPGDAEARVRLGQALAWRAEPAAHLDTERLDRLEETLRQRIQTLVTTHGGSSPRTARQFFAECDPARSGRVTVDGFVDVVGRKLNFSFPGGRAHAGSKELLAALYRRYDLERSGRVPIEGLHDLLRRATPGARAAIFLARLREGLALKGGGYEPLRTLRALWEEQEADAAAGDTPRRPKGCVSAAELLAGVGMLAALADLAATPTDNAAIRDTFRPPADDAAAAAGAGDDVTSCSYAELLLALRGPPMNAARRALVQRAWAAIRPPSGGVSGWGGGGGVHGGAVRPLRLAERYDASKHPGVVAGTLTEEEAAMAFLAPWAADGDARIEATELYERYEGISPLYDDDDAFDAMMRAVWHLE